VKTALITGITGQDGPFLARLLLSKRYKVYGMYRRSSLDINERLDEGLKDVTLIEGDVSDVASMIQVIKDVQPDEVYNLAAQSFVPASWTQPLATAQITGLGAINILEAIRLINKNIRYYQASTSELYGKVQETPQSEKTPFYPRSPYGVAKLYAFWISRNYSESFGIYACNGILFNHEGPTRGKQFVTRKITHSLAKIKMGLQDCLEIGNLDAKRDWGYAGDYVEAMWLMLQQERPEDFVIATGETHSVREFIEECFWVMDMKVTWEGEGVSEVGKIDGKTVVRVNPKFYRPAEVDLLLGDPDKAKKKLGWEPKTKFKELVKMMIEADLERVGQEK
jgi:GDPmannose 4,6-dehydratase